MKDDGIAARAKKLPPALTGAYRAAYKEVVWLFSVRRIYEQLFSTREKVEVLNDGAATAFGVIQMALSDQIVLSASRLTDKTKGTMNLGKLVKPLRKMDPGLNRTLAPKYDELKTLGKAMKDMRNTRIAHEWYTVAVGPKSFGHPLIEKEMVDAFCDGVSGFMTLFEQQLMDHATLFEQAYATGGDGDTLVCLLQKAKAYNRLAKRGVVRPGEWRVNANGCRKGEID